MSEEPIERLLRSAADWEPEVEVRAGLAHRAIQEKRRRSFRSLALAGTAFACGFGIMAVVQGVLPGAPPPTTPIATGNLGESDPVVAPSELPSGVTVVPAGQGKRSPSLRFKPTPTPSPIPKAKRAPRSLRNGPLAPHIRNASLDRSKFVPIDAPTVIPGVIAEPSADGSEVRLIPAAISPGDDDVIVTRSDASEGTRH